MITTTTTTTGGGGGGGGGSSSAAGGGGACTLKKGPWSAAEDAVLMEYVKKNGEGNWNAVQRNTGLQRCGKSCRLRWANHLRPNLKKGAFSVDEERLIIDLHSKLGNKWARISSHLPGRTDNEIKNYWNTRVKRRLRQGLPLYPNQNHTIPCQTPKIAPLLQPPSSLPFSFQKNTSSNNNNNNNNNNNSSRLSMFNPVSFPSPYFSLHQPPPFLPSNFLRHCPNTVPGRPPSSLSQMGTFQLSSSGFGFDSGQVPLTRFGSEGSFNFDGPRNFELPSNQLHQNDDQGIKVNHNNSNVGRTKSGLLDDLLQEAQVKVAGCGVKRERDDSGLHWDVSTSENSCTGIKKEAEGQQLKLGKEEELSNILELIPSLVQVPGWCNDDGGDESPAGQSASVVSTDDNYDKMPLPQPLPVVSTSDYEDDGDDWNPSCYTWDNLPRIC